MPPNSYSHNSNGINSNLYAPGGYEKTKSRKLLLIMIGIFATIATIALIVHFARPESQYTKSATAAARKQTPNAKVKGVKVAEGFAAAFVYDPTAEGQANSGNQTFFKINADGSMTQIASGSSFSPVDLLGFGIPLTAQAELTGRNLSQVQQDLAAACSYSGGDVPGYIGFGGSFNPGGWQIDAGTLDGLEQALTSVVSNENANVIPSEKVICVNATREKSNATTDKQTYISTFTLRLNFITGNGTTNSHIFTFAVGPNYYRSYTLDGHKIHAE